MYWWIFGISTFVLVASLLSAVIAASLSPLHTDRSPQKVSTSQDQLTAITPPTARTAAAGTPTPPAFAEIWVMAGPAIGTQAGNESGTITSPDIVQLDDGRWRMYYDQVSETDMSLIKSAISSDANSWTIEDGVRLPAGQDASSSATTVSSPRVVRLDDGRWRMYFQVASQASGSADIKYAYMSAASEDGVSFTPEPGIRFDSDTLGAATGQALAKGGDFYQAADGTYVTIFSANESDGTQSLDMATSSDGLSWANFKKLFPQLHDPLVLKTAQGYQLWATYLNERQGTIISQDGLSWPTAIAEVAFADPNGQKLTQANAGVTNLAGMVMGEGQIRLYANIGSPSNDIAYFDKQ